jgi:hypothetical protein
VSEIYYNHRSTKTARASFISDGGSNRHATNDISDLYNVRDVSVDVGVGGGSVKCTKEGEMRIFDNKTKNYVELKNTLYLPDCGRKLVSESRLDMGGCSITKPGDRTCVVAKNGKPLMVARMDAALLYTYDG